MKQLRKLSIMAIGLLCILFTYIGCSRVSDVYAEEVKEYSQEELEKVFNTIIDKYMLDESLPEPIVENVYIGGGALVDGQMFNFSEDSTVLRVVVSVPKEKYDEYKSMLEKEYGDIIYVIYEEKEDPLSEILFDVEDPENADSSENGSEDNSGNYTVPSVRTNAENSSNVLRLVIEIIIVAALVIGVVAFLIVSKKKKD